MNPLQIDTIPYDALIKVEFSGIFYERLQNCLFSLLKEKEDNPIELSQTLKELESRKPETDWEERVYILLAIVYEIDNQAVEQKLIVKKNIDVPTKGSSPEASPES